MSYTLGLLVKEKNTSETVTIIELEKLLVVRFSYTVKYSVLSIQGQLKDVIVDESDGIMRYRYAVSPHNLITMAATRNRV